MARGTNAAISDLAAARAVAVGGDGILWHIFDTWAASVAVLDHVGRIVLVNAGWRRTAGDHADRNCEGTNYLDVCRAAAPVAPVAGVALERLQAVLVGGRPQATLEYESTVGGVPRWYRMTIRPLELEGRRGTLVAHVDVTDTKRLQQDVEARSQLLDEVDAAVFVTDLDGVVQMWNRCAERTYGWSALEAVGASMLDLRVRAEDVDRSGAISELLETGSWEGQVIAARRDGSSFPAQVRNTVVRDGDGLPTAVVGVSVDISTTVAMEAELARSNRQLQAITDSIGEGVCTLDHELVITYLNAAGRTLLGARMEEVLGTDLGRWLGDGSGGLDLGASTGDGELEDAREGTLRRGDGTTLVVEYLPTPLLTPDETGSAGWVVVFRDVSERKAREAELAGQLEQVTWLTRIREALEHDGFVLHAQPIVEIATGATVQHELLLRMRDPEDPDGPPIPPGRFLPTAEALGLAPAIDRWVLARGFEIAASGCPVEMNLSATSLDDPTLPLLIEQLIRDTGADPASVVLEITETAMLENDHTARGFADQVRALGCELALDDFGTGYSGFGHLKRLPVDYLKIDIEFVRDVVTDEASRHVVDAIVSIAAAFGLRTVAEGVEDQATLELLGELGVDFAQGYHLGRPAPLAAQVTTSTDGSRPRKSP